MIKATILSIGSELLNGRTINSNATFIGKQLSSAGIEVAQCITIPDTLDAIWSGLKQCIAISDIVITTGGLGPTNDDITKQAIADFCSLKLVRSKIELKRLEHFFYTRGRELNKLNQSQADYPETADIFENILGTASGFHIAQNGKHIYSCPGVPYEMEYLVEKEFLPHILSIFPSKKETTTLVYRTSNAPESTLYTLAEDIILADNQVEFAFYPTFMSVDVKVTLPLLKVDKKKKKIEDLYKDYLYSRDEEISLQEVVGKLLVKQNATVSFAESCTGGLISHSVAQYSGASNYFKGSIISYSNEVKQSELGVLTETLETFDAVSHECVKEMADGVREKLKTDYSLSISGIAGPTGGTEEKPVGTVFIGISSSKGTFSEKFQLGIKRTLIQRRAVTKAIWLLLQELKK